MSTALSFFYYSKVNVEDARWRVEFSLHVRARKRRWTREGEKNNVGGASLTQIARIASSESVRGIGVSDLSHLGCGSAWLACEAFCCPQRTKCCGRIARL